MSTTPPAPSPDPRAAPPCFGRADGDLAVQRREVPEGLAPADAERVRERLREEARLLESLAHPGVPRVLSVELTTPPGSDRRPGIVLQSLRGVRLSAILDAVHGDRAHGGMGRAGGEPWSEHGALKVVVRLIETVAYAHARGVIHRALEPERVVVGHYGAIQVLGWDLARATERPDLHELAPAGPHDPDGARTSLAPRLAAPGYLAPELLRGEQYVVGPRTDVFALGAILHHLFTGRAPDPPAGSSAAGRLTRPHLRARAPRALARVIERSLSPQRLRRQSDAGRLLHELEDALAHGTARTGPVTGLVLWAREHRLAAALVLLAGGALLLRGRDAFPVPAEVEEARTAALEAGPAPEPTPPVVAREEAGDAGEGTQDPRDADGGSAANRTRPPTRTPIGRGAAESGPELASAATAASPTVPPPVPGVADGPDRSAGAAPDTGAAGPGSSPGRGVPAGTLAAAAPEPGRFPSPDDPRADAPAGAPRVARLAGTALVHGALLALRPAAASGSGTAPPADPEVRPHDADADATLHAAAAARDAGRWADAVALYDRLYREALARRGAGDEATLGLRRELARALGQDARPEEALIHYRGCLTLHAPADEFRLGLLEEFALLLLSVDARVEGEARLAEAAALATDLGGPDDATAARLYDQLASSAFRAGDLERVAAAFEAGLAARQRADAGADASATGAEGTEVLARRTSLVQIYRRLGRPTDALRHARALLAATPPAHAAHAARTALVASLEAEAEE